MIELHQLPLSSVPWGELDALPDRVVFQTREWLQYIADSQGAHPVVAEIREGGDLVGHFSGLVVRKFGVRILGSSFLGWTTPYIGFNLQPGRARAPLLAPLTSWAFRALRCAHVEISDRCFAAEDDRDAGMGASAYESYRSDLTRSEDELFGAMKSACRRCIRKAQRSGVVMVDRVRTLLRHMLPTGRLLAVRARNGEGRCIATGLYPGMNGLAFLWGNASWRPEQHWRPNELLHWYALRYWKARGAATFDWGGGGTYKKKYGVVPHAVPRFYKSKYGLLTTLRNDARSLFYRSRTLVGRLRGVRAVRG